MGCFKETANTWVSLCRYYEETKCLSTGFPGFADQQKAPIGDFKSLHWDIRVTLLQVSELFQVRMQAQQPLVSVEWKIAMECAYLSCSPPEKQRVCCRTEAFPSVLLVIQDRIQVILCEPVMRRLSLPPERSGPLQWISTSLKTLFYSHIKGVSAEQFFCILWVF